MPKCTLCESHVSHDYVRVFGDEEEGTVDGCYHCPDYVRSGSSVREARAPTGDDE